MFTIYIHIIRICMYIYTTHTQNNKVNMVKFGDFFDKGYTRILCTELCRLEMMSKLIFFQSSLHERVIFKVVFVR